MGKEVEATEEPEAAYLRGALRRIQGVIERTKEAGPWNLSTTAGLAEIATVLDAAMRRPATNGVVIDELYTKIAKLEAAAVDARLDTQAFNAIKTENATLREMHKRISAEASTLRSQLAQEFAKQSAGIDPAADAREFLRTLGVHLKMLGEMGAPLKLERAQEWAARLDAITGGMTS